MNRSTRDTFNARTYLFPIDETEEFHDPFSDLNLFLAKRIKKEILREKDPQKWPKKIQTILLKEILPDFTKKFPRYRLGNAALQKTWDKVLYYLQLIQGEKEALNDNGKLNIEFMIRENLKSFLQSQKDLDPYNFAHSLAIKISECIAAIDGERFQLDELTQMIWASSKHLVQRQETPQSYTPLDKLIIRLQLEGIAREPTLSHVNLMAKIKKQIQNMKQLDRIRNIDELRSSLSAILAEKLYPHLTLSSKEIESFVRTQIKRHTDTYELSRIQLVRRILFIYKLASSLSAEQASKGLEAALEYVFSLQTDSFSPTCPVLKQEVYTFIDSEITLLKEKKSANPLKEILSTLMELFREASELPKLTPSLLAELEILIWKIMHEEWDLVSRIPNYLQSMITEELANIHIDHPKESFQEIIHISLHYFKKVCDISIEELDRKVRIWTLQNDMILSSLKFDEDLPLIKCIKRHLKNFDLDEVIENYLKTSPSLRGWKNQLETRTIIMYKYLWYTSLAEENETAYDRFLKWHFHELVKQGAQFSELHFTSLEEITHNLSPLTPFSCEYARSLTQHNNATEVRDLTN